MRPVRKAEREAQARVDARIKFVTDAVKFILEEKEGGDATMLMATVVLNVIVNQQHPERLLLCVLHQATDMLVGIQSDQEKARQEATIQ